MQAFRIKGFEQIAVRTVKACAFNGLFGRGDGHEDEGRLFRRAQPARPELSQQIQVIIAFQLLVANDRVDMMLCEMVRRILRARFTRDCGVAFLLEIHLRQPVQSNVIVYKQNPLVIRAVHQRSVLGFDRMRLITQSIQKARLLHHVRDQPGQSGLVHDRERFARRYG